MLLFVCLHIPFCISFNPTLPKLFRDRKQEGASVDWALVWEDPHKSRSVQGTQGEGHLGLRADLKQYIYIDLLRTLLRNLEICYEIY